MRRHWLPPLWLATALLAGGCAHEPVTRGAPGGNHIAERAADHALSMVGRPYRYGGNTPQGFDCSGLVQYSYSKAGMALPRSTDHLLRVSRPVPLGQAQRGDLLFFDQEGRKASHVGIYLGEGRFVHAPSTGKRVYVTDLADPYWRRHLSGVRRPHGVD